MKTFFLLLGFLFLPLAAFAQEFVPLTGLPGLSAITDTSSTASLPDFFNGLYRICIGAAAVIAVFQIMYAGVQSILQEGSVLQKSKVRDRIQQAIIGLVLVLSPAIVFGIIDPRILNLDIGNLGSLKLQEGNGTGNGTGNGDGGDQTEGELGEDEGTDNGGESGGDGDGGEDGGENGESDGQQEELPDEIIVQPDENPPANAVTAQNVTISVTAKDYYTSMKTANAVTYNGGSCKLIQVVDYVREPASAASARCQERASSSNLANCVAARTVIQKSVQGACVVNGTPLIDRSEYN